MTLEKYALEYFKKGFTVLPLNGKKPYIKWDKLKNEKNTEDQIKRWWKKWPDANIGIIPGSNNHVVIDVDVKGKVNGFDSLKKWEKEHGEIDKNTYAVDTPSGGKHYYYYIDKPNFNPGNKNGVLPGIDIRYKDGYVVAPPSSIGGKKYKANDNKITLYANQPVLDLINAKKLQNDSTGNDVSTGNDFDFVEGERDNKLFEKACELRDIGLEKKEVLQTLRLLNLNRCKPPLDDNTVKQKVDSAYSQPPRAIKFDKEEDKKAPKLSPISAKDLEELDIPPVKWIVKDLLPVGLSILGAPPKYFKSFMALQLCIDVSKGIPFLDFETVKSGTLYFDLESTKRRPKDRLEKINGVFFPGNLYLITDDDDVKKINEGFEEQLNTILDEHPDIKLVVIDVFQKIRPPQRSYKAVYDRDYDDLAPLKKIADSREICIVLIHHTKKAKENDVFDNLSGSTGLTGSMDTTLVITKKDRFSNEGVLNVTGREIDSKRLKIEFDKDSFQWISHGDMDIFEMYQKEQAYLSNPVVLTIKAIVETFKDKLPWEGSASDIKEISRFFDIGIDDDARSIGKTIQMYTNKLEIEGIRVEKNRVGNKRKYIINVTNVTNEKTS